MYHKLIASFLSVLLSGYVLLPGLASAEQADVNKTEEIDFNPATLFLGMEALAVLNSWMAAERPKLYGGAAALLFPLATDCSTSKITCTTGLVAAESLAIYNLTIDQDEQSKSETFKANMIAWHVLAGAIGIASFLVEDDSKEMSFAPLPSGGMVKFSYEF